MSSQLSTPSPPVVHATFVDVWFHPTLWNGIVSAAIYACFGLFGAFVWRRRCWIAMLMPIGAAVCGFVSGFVSGSLTFLPIAGIYTSSGSAMPNDFAILLGTFFALFYFVVVVLRICCAG